MRLIFSASAFRQLLKLDKQIQKRIVEKLDFYISQDNPLEFAERLMDPRFGQWKFRIGDYRVLFDVADATIEVLRIGHRRYIYK